MSANLAVKPAIVGKTSATGAEWIDRYVHEVGRRLPPNQRADVQQEIRSLIEDEVAGRLEAAADDRSTQANADATVLAVLEQFGAPEEMAARYQAPRYLIGPAMFPVYQIVLGIVLTVTVFANLLLLAVAAGTGGVQPLIDMLADLFTGVLQAFGTVTLIFVGLERLGVSASRKKAVSWDPRSLPPVKDEQRVSIFEKAVEIGFMVALLGLAVNYLNRGAAVFAGGEWQAIPLFSPEVLQYIPWLMVIWGADILVNIVLLARGRWEPATRVAAMVVDGANALVFYQLLVGGPIAAWPPVDPAFRITAAIIFAVSVWEVVRNAWRLLRSGTWGEAALHSQHVV
ncbi:MAG: hypothetical protein U0X20_03535 [Caldilineaceae bacterium]